jgi:chromosome partitioning protein
MGTILTIAASKGGAGKTTLTQCLAANLAIMGYRLIVIDADMNGTFSDWHANAYEGPAFDCMVQCGHVEVVDAAQAEAERRDIVLIDTAGFSSLTAASSISVADFVLIPCMPDRGSVREAIRTARQVESLSKAARRALPYRIVGTQWREGGQVEGATMAAIEAEGLPMMAHRLPFLAAFRKASFTGKVPVSGRVGLDADALIAELAALGAVGAEPEQAREVG